ncbi:MAG: hypothetical protein SFV21_04610 [Rhodospirillaceae bacterium]|nr:hypothetical protein [Rhodospirillaceae bacterium]
MADQPQGSGAKAQVRLWWPVKVLQRRYAAHAELAPLWPGLPEREQRFVPAGADPALAAFVQWVLTAAADLIAADLRPGAQPPVLSLGLKRLTAPAVGQVPRRTPAAVFAGLYCFDPGTIDARQPEAGCLTFLDPRPGAEMIPGSSAPLQPDRILRLPAGALILYPAWLAQGSSAPLGPEPPRWLSLRFRPVPQG